MASSATTIGRSANTAMNDRSGSSAASSEATIDFQEIDQKQQELRGAVQHRIATLERALVAREQQVQALQTQLRKLEEDYQYNFNLIGERDRAIEEAAAYVVRFDTQLKQAVEELARERQQRATIAQQLANAEEQIRSQHDEYDSKMADARRQVEHIQLRHQREMADKIAEINHVRDELQGVYSARVAEDDKARSLGIASMEASKREMEDAFRKREANLERELQQWRDKFAAQRDENAVLIQEAAAAARSREHLEDELKRLERAAEEDRRREETLRSLSAERDAKHEASHKQLTEQVASLQCDNQRLTTDLHTSRTAVEQLQSRASLLDNTQEAHAARFAEACDTMRRNYESTLAQMQASVTALERRGASMQQTNTDLQEQLSEAHTVQERRQLEIHALQSQSRDAASQISSLKSELEKLKFELSQQRETFQQDHDRWSMERQRSQEQLRASSMKLEAATQELSDLRHDVTQKAQQHAAEVSRLSRDLHASEAGRQALESQIALLQDDHGLQRQLERCLRDKRECEERIIQLQHTNEAIRHQVDQFTQELQNDPVVRNARLNGERVAELEAQVRELEARLGQRDELNRQQSHQIRQYQEEILSQQGSTRAMMQLSEDHARLKRDLEDVQRAKALAFATEEEGTDGRSVEALKEAEFWRQRAKQLEVALSEAVSQRTAKVHELREAQQALQALTMEKRSLTDVNSMLKAQLKQSYADTASIAHARVVAAPLMTAEHHPYPTTADQTDATRSLPAQRQALPNGRQASTTPSAAASAASGAARPTASWKFRTGEKPLQRSPPHAEEPSGYNSSRSVSMDGIMVQGTGSQSKLVRRGTSSVRHYGV